MKRIVVCCDGTWNKGDAKHPTNVRKIATAAERARPAVPQVVRYMDGVGTEGSWWDRVRGGVTGHGLAENVEKAYKVIVEQYEDEEDEVFLFGFSRGAYTARSVAGMVRKCGLLREPTPENLHKAYRFYRSKEKADSKAAEAFRRDHSRDVAVPIRFLGVWDTVGHLGIPYGPLRSLTARRHRFHDVQLSRIVQTACHAVAIDERRHAFKPTLWGTKVVDTKTPAAAAPSADREVHQAWFAGVHSGVGGGQSATGLSDIALLWMKHHAHAAGLRFDEAYLDGSTDPSAQGDFIESRRTLWRLLPGGWRPMGRKTHWPQRVHATAVARCAAPVKPPYPPPNLRKALAAGMEKDDGEWM